MLSSILFAGVGVLGAGYSFIISVVAINHGPKCLVFKNDTHSEWSVPFSNGWDTNKQIKNIKLLCRLFLHLTFHPFQRLPVQHIVLVTVFRARWCGVLASLSVLGAAGHGVNPDSTVCCAGGERPAGSSMRGLLWLLRRGKWLG